MKILEEFYNPESGYRKIKCNNKLGFTLEKKCANCGNFSVVKDHYNRVINDIKAGKNAFCNNSCSTSYKNKHMTEYHINAIRENGIKQLVKYNKSLKGREKSPEILKNITRIKLKESGCVGSEEQKTFLNKRNTEQSKIDQVCA